MGTAEPSTTDARSSPETHPGHTAVRLMHCEHATATLAAEVASLRAEVAAMREMMLSPVTRVPLLSAPSAMPDNDTDKDTTKEKEREKSEPIERSSESRASAFQQRQAAQLHKQQQQHQQQQQQQVLNLSLPAFSHGKSQSVSAKRQTSVKLQPAYSDLIEDEEPLEFTSPAPELLTTGEKNTLKYRAWTDIVRVRYPNFQRVSPAMSKAARYFREENNLQLVRLVAQTSLKANVTLAIPEHAQQKFLRYMEDLFVQGNTGIFGDKTNDYAASNQAPSSGSSSLPVNASMAVRQQRALSGIGSGASKSLDNPGGSVSSRKRSAPAGMPVVNTHDFLGSSVTGYGGGMVGAPSASLTKRSRVLDYVNNDLAVSAESFSSVYDMATDPNDSMMYVCEEGELVDPDLEGHTEGSFLKSKSGVSSLASNAQAFVFNKSGVKLIRYNLILQKLMREFKSLPKDARVAIKKGVKAFLQHEMGDQFEDCIITTSDADKVNTYGVPEFLMTEFKAWACQELGRCFPTCEILDRDCV
ncbi:hypothetical protein HDU77_003869 [Chytriomyces hyalinus]|nr:hypothetical protein HDU77_003869 [Chytriomyces hyalinus]